MQGQSFTTASDAPSYQLVSVTYLLAETDGTILGWKDHRIRVGTITLGPDTETPIIDTTVRFNPDAPTGTYFTVTFDTPIDLDPDTLFGFSMGIAASQEGWGDGIPTIRASSNAFAGGQRYQTANQSSVGTDAPANISLQSQDLIFALDIVAVPEPGSLILLGLGSTLMLARRRK